MASIGEGHVIAGKYRIDRPLSRGGMGSVWVAQHTELGMRVAVKLMDPNIAASDEGRARFAREAKAAAAIQSPHVVKVHDYGVDGDTPYLVMELLDGEDLGARLRREGRLGLPVTARLVTQIAKGLKRAHDAGIVHRDLKPANVFLVRCDEDEIVQILDFGLAKQIRPRPEDKDVESTDSGVVLGSMHYMSPEQARGYKGIDHRTDVWSLGIIVYRALTGDVPFPGNEIGDVLVKLCTEPLPAASARIPDLDPATGRQLDVFFSRALARDPAERFSSARELAAALAGVAGIETGEPAMATVRPPAASLRDAPTVVTAMPGRVGATPVASQALTPVHDRESPTRPDEREATIEGTWAAVSGQKRGSRSLRRVAGAVVGGAVVIAALVLGLARTREPAAGNAAVAPSAAIPVVATVEPGSSATATTPVDTAAPTVTPAASASARPSSAPRGPGPDRVKRKFGF
ncbi:MAG: serine/threonine-protein kinase [Minicystis sp.]